jgi:hypothetical protein
MNIVNTLNRKQSKMENYRYTLEPYKGINTRYTCPNCDKRKVFARYIDTKTGEHLPEQYGKCNRLYNCGYDLNPYKDGYTQMIYEQEKGNLSGFVKNWKPTKPMQAATPISFIPVKLFKQSLRGYEVNNFVNFLINLFGNEKASQLISKYFIGTSKHWQGANIFWQIDIDGKIRTGKIMLYNPNTGKRIKEPFNYVTWVHAAVKQSKFELKQCFFGEHLLKGNLKPVAIVESEKTAIIASVYFPKFIWLACGGLNGLTVRKCEILKNKNIVLYPDLSKPQPNKRTAFEIWKAKCQEFAHIANFSISDLLEVKAGEAEMEKGYDLADYLIKFDYKDFIEPEKFEEDRINVN